MALASAGRPALPLFGPEEGLENEKGKRPRQSGWQGRVNTPEQISYWFDQYPRSNLGLVTGAASGLAVIDVDPRNGGDAWYKANEGKLGGGIIETTGSGGLHLFFKHPGGFVQSRTGKCGIAPGVELKCDGGSQIVICPSIHKTGVAYTCPMSIEDVLVWAEILPEWLGRPMAAPDQRTSRKESYQDRPEDIETCRARLAALAPAIENQGGDAATFVAACLGRDHDLSPDTFLPLLQAWNETCQPPWTADDLVDKMRHAYRYAKAVTPGSRLAASDFAQIDASDKPVASASPEEIAKQNAADQSWRAELLVDKYGSVKNLENNIDLILRRDPALRGLVRWNEFTSGVELASNPLWARGRTSSPEWSEVDDLGLVLWLGRTYKVGFDQGKVARVVNGVSRRFPWHPIREYLDGLKWDGTPRLDNFLVRYFGAEVSPYVNAVGRCMLIAAVARVRVPGVKLDNVPILEGIQGIGKSTALSVLAGADWFTDAEINPGEKDAALAIRGRWLVELGELAGLKRSEVNELKAWITRQVDRIRDPYASRMADTPRQCLFIGTSNNDSYLKDETGGRRYWPVRVSRINLEALKADRDQLWAEASHRHAAGEQWWLKPEEEKLAAIEQADRFIVDPWTESIAEWLENGTERDGQRITKTTSTDIMKNALHADIARVSYPDACRVSAIMKHLGWKRIKVNINGEPKTGFKRMEKSDPTRV